VPSHGNLLFISSQQIQKSILEKFPEIGRIKVEKNFLTRKLVIDVVERQELAAWCLTEAKHPILPCIALDSQGVSFREKKEIPADIPIIVFSQVSPPALGSVAIDPKILPFVVELKRTLESWNIFQIASVKIQSFSLEPGFIAVHTTEGWDAYFTQEEDRVWQETKLREVLEKQFPQEKRHRLEYIDVRFGNQAYIK
jgi:cell division septal protein FtsQ